MTTLFDAKKFNDICKRLFDLALCLNKNKSEDGEMQFNKFFKYVGRYFYDTMDEIPQYVEQLDNYGIIIAFAFYAEQFDDVNREFRNVNNAVKKDIREQRVAEVLKKELENKSENINSLRCFIFDYICDVLLNDINIIMSCYECKILKNEDIVEIIKHCDIISQQLKEIGDKESLKKRKKLLYERDALFAYFFEKNQGLVGSAVGNRMSLVKDLNTNEDRTEEFRVMFFNAVGRYNRKKSAFSTFICSDSKEQIKTRINTSNSDTSSSYHAYNRIRVKTIIEQIRKEKANESYTPDIYEVFEYDKTHNPKSNLSLKSIKTVLDVILNVSVRLDDPDIDIDVADSKSSTDGEFINKESVKIIYDHINRNLPEIEKYVYTKSIGIMLNPPTNYENVSIEKMSAKQITKHLNEDDECSKFRFNGRLYSEKDVQGIIEHAKSILRKNEKAIRASLNGDESSSFAKADENRLPFEFKIIDIEKLIDTQNEIFSFDNLEEIDF
ncbi:MAG: hypothetical protein K6F27_11575 [Ruminococcus sp.]|nr:hypothetical protein [Ruminococcus sp.]